MKHIYLIRHGRPDFPEGVRMCLGSTDLPLNATGFAQARAMAEKLAGKKLQVFASPLIRAIQTAQALGQPVEVLEGLREWDCGQWDGLDFVTIARRYPELYAARELDRTLPIPGGEDQELALIRFRRALTEAAERSDGDLAAVSHGGVTAKFVQSLTGEWKKPDYAEIFEFIYENGNFTFLGGYQS